MTLWGSSIATGAGSEAIFAVVVICCSESLIMWLHNIEIYFAYTHVWVERLANTRLNGYLFFQRYQYFGIFSTFMFLLVWEKVTKMLDWLNFATKESFNKSLFSIGSLQTKIFAFSKIIVLALRDKKSIKEDLF